MRKLQFLKSKLKNKFSILNFCRKTFFMKMSFGEYLENSTMAVSKIQVQFR